MTRFFAKFLLISFQCIVKLQAMNSGTLVVLSLLDLGTSPGVRAAEESADLQQRLGELVAETNRVGRAVVAKCMDFLSIVVYVVCLDVRCLEELVELLL